MTDLSFANLVDIEQIRELLEAHYKITGVSAGILDTDENILVAVGYHDICTRFHLVHPIAKLNCRESDAYIKAHLSECEDGYLDYRCKNGLVDVAFPIIIRDVHLATFFTGQFFYDDDKPDVEFFREQAETFGFDENGYLEALGRVPVFSRDWIHKIVQYYRNLVKLIAGMGLKNLELHREAAERERIESVITARLLLLRFAATHTLDELLEATLNEAELLTGSVISFYHFLEADQKTLSLQNWSVRTKNEFCMADGKWCHYDVSAAGVWVDCIHERRPVIHNDYALLPHRKGLPPGHAPVFRELGVPVFHGDRIVAILGVGNKPGNYTTQDVETVALLADLAWEITERKRAEEALLLSLYCIDKAGIGVFQGGHTGAFFSVNEQACKSLGSSKEELCALSVFDIDPEITPEKMLVLKKILDEKRTTTLYTTHLRKDGTTLPVEITINYLDFHGKRYGISFVKDITERKRAEEERRKSEENFSIIFQATPDLIAITRASDGTILEVNEAFSQLLGYSRAEAIGKCTEELSIWADPADRARWMAEIEVTCQVNEFETTLRCRDGSLITCVSTARPLDFGGEKCVLSVVRDITERKRAEEELQLNQFCIDKAGIGIYQSDGTGTIFNVNEYACKSLGYSREELCALSVFDIDPEITPERMLELKEILDERGSVTHQTTHRRRDGTTFPVEITANNLNFHGKEYGISFVKDITERREAEESLKRAKEEWERTFASVPDLIAILDNRHGVLRVNDAMAKRLGLKPDECAGLPCYAAVHGLSEPPGFCPHTQTLRDGREHVVEVHEERLGGDFLASTIPLNDERGVMIGSVHIAYDITERKRAEEALKESESRVRRKLESILDPEGDTGELDLADIIDAPQIQALMDDLYRNTGLKMSIIDLKGRVLVDVGWQDICLKFHRAHPETLKNCHESDTDLTVGVPPGEFRAYRCRNNMWHLVTPIFVGGRHMGNLFMGQFFLENEELDYDLFRAQARQYGFPEDEYIAALEAVPRRSEERVNKGKAFFLQLIDMFSKLSYGNIKLARSLAERDRLTETLRQANLVVENSPVVLFRWKGDDEWPVELVSGNITRFGYTPEEFLSRSITYSSIIHADDLERVTREVHDFCNGGADHFRLEYRIMTKGGDVRWVNEHSNVERDADGCVKNFEGIVIDVTERKLAEDAIHDSRAKYQAIVDNFEGLIYICSQDYRVEFMNRKLIERTGYDATGEFCYKMMHDRDSVCPWCVNERVLAGETLHWEMFSPKDNRWYYVVNVPIPHADGTISKQSMMLDITDRKQAEEDLRKANMVVENSPVVLFRCKAAPCWPVELVSKNVVQFGYTPEEFLSGELTYSSIVYPRDLGKLTAETEEYSATGKGKWLREYRIVTKEGDIRWISDETVCERNKAGEITHYEGVIIDVTERRKAEEQLILQQMQLRELNSTLEERVRVEVEKNREKDIILIQQNRQAALGELFDHIAHQWKQPLNSIAVVIQALGSTCAYEQVTTKDILETVDNIMDMVGHMAQTVDVFRNFYKPDKEKSVFLVKDTVDKALSFVTPVFRRYGIGVDVDAEPELSALGYPKECAQVLLNLLGNAKDALTERRIENPRINIKAFADGEYAVVTIADNAGGVPDTNIEHIFDLYFTTKESSGGTGIGLYMSRNIIEKNMGGKLTVSNVDKGAQFRIELGKS